MLTTATSEVMRLMSVFVRRLDAELVESAARNAESSVLDQHRRWFEEIRTLSDLHAIEERLGRAPAGPTRHAQGRRLQPLTPVIGRRVQVRATNVPAARSWSPL